MQAQVAAAGVVVPKRAGDQARGGVVLRHDGHRAGPASTVVTRPLLIRASDLSARRPTPHGAVDAVAAEEIATSGAPRSSGPRKAEGHDGRPGQPVRSVAWWCCRSWSGCTASSASATSSSRTTAIRVVTSGRRPRQEDRRPGVCPGSCRPPPVGGGRGSTRTTRIATPRRPGHDAQPATSGPREARAVQLVVDLPGPGGAVGGAGLHQAGSGVEHRGDVAVRGRRGARRRMPAPASSSTTWGVGRDTSARTVEVKSVSSAVRSTTSSSPVVIPSPRRTLYVSPSSTLPRTTRDPVLPGPSSALHHVDRDVGLDAVLDGVARPGQPPRQSAERYGRPRPRRRLPPPAPRPHSVRRGAEAGGDDERAPQDDDRRAPRPSTVAAARSNDTRFSRARQRGGDQRHPLPSTPGPGWVARGTRARDREDRTRRRATRAHRGRRASGDQADAVGRRRQPADVEQQRAAGARAGRRALPRREQQRRQSTATAGGPQTDRSRITPRTIANAAATTTSPSATEKSQAPGERRGQGQQQAGPARPRASAGRHRSGRRTPGGVREPRQGGHDHDTEPAVPHAPVATRTTAHVDAPHSSTHRDAPDG